MSLHPGLDQLTCIFSHFAVYFISREQVGDVSSKRGHITLYVAELMARLVNHHSSRISLRISTNLLPLFIYRAHLVQSSSS